MEILVDNIVYILYKNTQNQYDCYVKQEFKEIARLKMPISQIFAKNLAYAANTIQDEQSNDKEL